MPSSQKSAQRRWRRLLRDPNIQNANPAMLEYVKQDILPVSNDPEKNKMAIASISISVTKNEDPNVVAVPGFSEKLSGIFRCSKNLASGNEPSPTAIQGLEVSEKSSVDCKRCN